MKRGIFFGRVHSYRPWVAGFTLLEIIAVMLLLGIIGAVVFSRSFNPSADLLGEVEVIKGHLRYAQIKAMNSDQPWGINFSGNSYTLEKDGLPSIIPLPGQDSSTYILDKGTVSATVDPVVFDQWGDPGAVTITVSVSSGGDSRSFTISQVTGFIP